MTQRTSAQARGYSARWQTAAATFKQRAPWCLGCQALGRLVATQVVDHVQPHRGDPVKFWDSAMWQPACQWCHNGIKRSLEQMFLRGEIDCSQLWLNSSTAKKLSRSRPRPRPIGADGWFAGQ